MGIILTGGLVLSVFLRLFYSIEGDFAFDALTFVLIIAMVYHLNTSKDVEISKSDVILIVSATIVTIVITVLIINMT